MSFVDTNIFLRYLTRDDPIQSEASRRFIALLRDGLEEATTSEAVVTEIVYVLTRRYRLGRQEIAEAVRPLVTLRSLDVPNRDSVLRAFALYATHSIDIEDALSVAHMERRGINEIVSYDRDFDRIPEVKRVEP